MAASENKKRERGWDIDVGCWKYRENMVSNLISQKGLVRKNSDKLRRSNKKWSQWCVWWRNALFEKFLFWKVTFHFGLVCVVSPGVPFWGEHSTACLDALAAVLKEILANYSCASRSLLLPPPVSPGLSCALEAPIHPPWYLLSPQKALSHAISERKSRKESVGHLLDRGKKG